MTSLPTPSTKSRPRVKLYVRSLFPRGAQDRQERVVAELRRLAEAGHITDFSVVVWGKRLALDDEAARTDAGQHVRDRVTEFEQWAREENVSLESFYRTRAGGSDGAADARTVLTFPVMGLAEYVDGELAHVAPCTDDGRVRRVEDRLDTLATVAPGNDRTDERPTDEPRVEGNADD